MTEQNREQTERIARYETILNQLNTVSRDLARALAGAEAFAADFTPTSSRKPS